MRAIGTAIYTLLFIVLYNLYMVFLKHDILTDVFMKKAYMYFVVLVITAPLLIMGNSNNKSIIEIEIRKIAEFIYIATILTIILNQFGLFVNPINNILLFNGINIVIISIILISGGRHGYYKKKK